MWNGAWGWHWMGGIGMLLFWVLIILLVLGALKYLRSGPADRPGVESGKTAMDFLEEAYAKGEITREEFLQKRADIRDK
ncbi:SHOCT domain-containing protein [Noviherbaspirillum sp. UKPF54]|nr:SHOCT domain-containing protein [Noviherbaspirillum sp. UKPF54]